MKGILCQRRKWSGSGLPMTEKSALSMAPDDCQQATILSEGLEKQCWNDCRASVYIIMTEAMMLILINT